VNQLLNPGAWNLIATGIQFDTGTNGYVRLSNNTGESGRQVVADAVRWSLSGNQNSAPFVISPPQDSAVRLGDEAHFSVVVGGSAPFTYQWRFGNNNIPGATNNILSIANVQNENLGNYSVAIGNAFGAITNSVTLALAQPFEPVLHSLSFSNNQLRLFVDAEAGYSYSVEVSTNLVDWSTLTNITSEGVPIEVSDTLSSNEVQRFYRGRWNQ
ncbi:MAG: immunoglobulin domain-containing protein, partial [Limisphaerales bacterium]